MAKKTTNKLIKKMSYTRQQLIEAMQKYNDDVLHNPNDFDPITNERECAELQVDKLISFID